MEKYEETLEKAIKEIKIADHIIYITYHIVKDKRLLIKALEQEYNSLMLSINAILQYDYTWKKIQIYHDAQLNFETFLNKCAIRYSLDSQDIKDIKELITLIETHKKSPMEFMRREKVMIMTGSLKTEFVDLIKLKKYLNLIKKIIKKAAIQWNKQVFLN